MACGWLLGSLEMLSTEAQSSPGHEDREMGNHKKKHKRQEHDERNVSFAVPAE